MDAPDKEVTVSGTAANDRAAADAVTMTVTAATLTIADDERGFAFARAGGGPEGFDGVLDVAEGGEAAYTVALASETTVAVAAGATATYTVEGRRVEVRVAPGVPAGVEVDFAGVGSVPAGTTPTMTVRGPAAVDATVVARAAGDGFNLGPEGLRTVVDVEVTDLPGVGLCLPVDAAVVAELPEGGAGRLLRYDADAWGVVGEDYRPAAGTAPGWRRSRRSRRGTWTRGRSSMRRRSRRRSSGKWTSPSPPWRCRWRRAGTAAGARAWTTAWPRGRCRPASPSTGTGRAVAAGRARCAARRRRSSRRSPTPGRRRMWTAIGTSSHSPSR